MTPPVGQSRPANARSAVVAVSAEFAVRSTPGAPAQQRSRDS